MSSPVVLTKMAIAHALCHVTCRLGARNNQKFGNLDPDLPAELQGATMMIKGSLLCSIPIVKLFYEESSKSQKMGQKN